MWAAEEDRSDALKVTDIARRYKLFDKKERKSPVS